VCKWHLPNGRGMETAAPKVYRASGETMRLARSCVRGKMSSQTKAEPKRIGTSSRYHTARKGALPQRRNHEGRTGRVLRTYLLQRCCVSKRPPDLDGAISDGVTGEGFFQKKAGHISRTGLPRLYWPSRMAQFVTLSARTMQHTVYLAGQAVITPHTWLSRDKPNHPDQLIFDLDPSGEDFKAVCAPQRNFVTCWKGMG